MPPPPNKRVAALVVTYFPDAGLPDRLDRLLAQVERVLIVDNGSDAARLAWAQLYSDRANVTIHCNSSNVGIAAALNQGMQALTDEGFEWVFTSDQDSTVADGCIAALLAAAASDMDAAVVAMVGSNRQDVGLNATPHRWLRAKNAPPFFEHVTCDRIGRDGVTLVITSGTLMSATAFECLGPFREDFFIDLVDFEYCLRARKAGYRILVSCQAEISHRVGSRTEQRIAGIRLAPTHHSPVRKYYLFRNAVSVARSYGLTFPHWLLYQIAALFEVILGILFIERCKGRKLKACMFGLWDGILGRMGVVTRDL